MATCGDGHKEISYHREMDYDLVLATSHRQGGDMAMWRDGQKEMWPHLGMGKNDEQYETSKERLTRAEVAMWRDEFMKHSGQMAQNFEGRNSK